MSSAISRRMHMWKRNKERKMRWKILSRKSILNSLERFFFILASDVENVLVAEFAFCSESHANAHSLRLCWSFLRFLSNEIRLRNWNELLISENEIRSRRFASFAISWKASLNRNIVMSHVQSIPTELEWWIKQLTGRTFTTSSTRGRLTGVINRTRRNSYLRPADAHTPKIITAIKNISS